MGESGLRPDLDATFIGVIVADDVHFILCKLDDTFLLQLLDSLYNTCPN